MLLYFVTKCRRMCILIVAILQAIEDANNDIQISHSTLHRILWRMGFRWKKAIDNLAILMENQRIGLLRIQFLKKMIEYRKESRPTIYTDETYIHSSHTQSKDWIDMTKPEMSLKHPISKGQRLIIVHAGEEDGFIANGLLIFKSGSESGNYHKDKNHNNFMKWVEKQHLQFVWCLRPTHAKLCSAYNFTLYALGWQLMTQQTRSVDKSIYIYI